MTTFPALDVPEDYVGPDGEVAIYALVDPVDETVRYVGRSSRLRLRESAHLSSAERSDSEKARWIRALATEGKRPVLVTLAMCTSADAAVEEAKWIGRFAERGRLYNDLLAGEFQVTRNDPPTSLRLNTLKREAWQARAKAEGRSFSSWLTEAAEMLLALPARPRASKATKPPRKRRKR